MPKKVHGTSLMETENEFLQIGFSIGIGNWLGKSWEKYLLGELKEEDIKKELANMDAENEELEDNSIEQGEIEEWEKENSTQ